MAIDEVICKQIGSELRFGDGVVMWTNRMRAVTARRCADTVSLEMYLLGMNVSQIDIDMASDTVDVAARLVYEHLTDDPSS